MTPSDLIAQALAGSTRIRDVRIGAGALHAAGDLYTRHFGSGPACLIADENTFAAAGPAVEAALNAAGIATRRHVLPALPRPKPTVELSSALQAVLASDEAVPVAIGSGVLNDVVKHAAHALDRPYFCVATAASMDGYTSAGAPLSDRGFKMTIQCRPARVILADLDVLAAAPRAMTGWGYADLAGKVPAGADWILAEALGVEPIDDTAWPMVQTGLRGWLSDPQAVAAGDPTALQSLFAGLTLVGFAMEAHGSSRPASGADHQIAHLWEMADLMHEGARVSHGACVAIGTTTVLALYDWTLARDFTTLDIDRLVAEAPDLAAKAAAIETAFGPGEIATRCLAETRAKHPTPEALRIRLHRLATGWPDLRSRLQRQTLSAPDMRAALRAAGAPSEAADIGLTNADLRRTTLEARFLRSRYTILDLLDETGLLPAAVADTLPIA